MGLQLVGAVRDYLAACEKGTDGADDIARMFKHLRDVFHEMTFADGGLIEAARVRHCYGSDDEIEVDDVDVATSESGDNGVWVEAWLWVPVDEENES